MTIAVIDSPNPALVAQKANALRVAGPVEAAILYLSPINPNGSKTVRKAHIDTCRAAGLAVGFVCEGWGGSDNFEHHDITAATGARDGAFCGRYLQGMNTPAGVAVFPTVDNDVTSAQLSQLCLPYFRAFRTALPSQYRMGAYGCGALLFGLEAEPVKIMDFPWLSNALGWSRSREYASTGRAAISQRPATTLLGIDVDPNVLNPNMKDFGFWLP